ncbi:MAG: hypothetical protein NVS4B9_34000 [Ktedonobacteraceae bacterium]
MAVALRNKQMLALIIIAFLTLVAITFIVLSVAHIGVGQALHSVVPMWSFGYS